VGKLELVRAVADDPALIALVFVGGALSFVYALQVYQYDFWRASRSGPPSSRRGQQAVVAVLALTILAAGLWPEPLLSLSHDAAAALAGSQT
jgi:multicomponent Na+:H+ antiporter subunit D